MAQTKKELPALRKQSDTFKIVVPLEVEEKIRHLCRHCPKVEWSGKLFYKTEGSVANKDLVITCVDLYVMDIGTGGYTEFDETPDFFGYMVDKDLMDTNVGLIHSHNMMSTFFSGTDLATLQEEGNDNNHFVSLIVNNAGKYTAAVTRKVITTMNVVATDSFRTFDDSEVKIEGKKEWQQTHETIEYYMLDVDKAEVPNTFHELDLRLEEIRKAKEKAKKPEAFAQRASDYYRGPWSGQMPSLFSQEELEGAKGPKESKPLLQSDNGETFISEGSYVHVEGEDEALINEELVESGFDCGEDVIEAMTLQLVTGSIALTDTSRTDMDKLVKSMEPLLDKRFSKDYGVYSYWMEGYFDFLLEERMPDGLTVDAENKAMILILTALLDRFSKLPTTEYTSKIVEYIEIKLQ